MSRPVTNLVDEELSCCASDPLSVEARFGLLDCRRESGDSRCEYVLPTWAVGPDGRPRAGAFAVAVDHVLGEVGFIRRPAGTWSVTTELTLDFHGDLVAPGTTLQVTGAPIRLERRAGFIKGAVTTATGAPVMLATTRIANIDAEAPAPRVLASSSATDTGRLYSAAALEHHLGITYFDGAGGVTACLGEPAAWTNDLDILHGGVWACLAEATASRALAEVNPALSTSQIHVSYLRPGVPTAGVNASATILHAGGHFALASVRGYADDGTLCTVSSITARRIGPPVQ